MRQKVKRQERSDELVLAIGLVWGHLNTNQYEEAYLLAKGCLRVWPDDKSLVMMAAYAAAEVLEPVDEEKLAAMRTPEYENWVKLVLRRKEIRQQAAKGAA